MVPTSLYVLGAGGTALDVIDIVAALAADGAGWRVAGLLDDDPAKLDKTFGGVPVLGPLSEARELLHRDSTARFLDALGSPRSFRKRREVSARAGVAEDRFATLVHPRATVSPSAVLGAGVLLYPGVVVGANVRLGAHVTVLANAVINHDSSVGDYSILTSGVMVSGRVRIGERCYVGSGALLIQDLTVGDEALIGMGSVVIRDVPAGLTVAGNPARQVKEIGGR